MVIELKADAEPYYLNCARPILFVDWAEVKKLLVKYVDTDFIPMTEASEWVAHLVITRKSDGSLRVDHTKFNRHMRWPTHPNQNLKDAVAETRLISPLFASVPGYFQIPLHPSLQHLIVFMTSLGR